MRQSLALTRQMLDLDDPLLGDTRLDIKSPSEPSSDISPTWESCRSWLSILILTALEEDAEAIRIDADNADNEVRQMILAKHPDRRSADAPVEWFHCMPLDGIFIKKSIKTVRRLACLRPWRRCGVIHYRYLGDIRKADCEETGHGHFLITLTGNEQGEGKKG